MAPGAVCTSTEEKEKTASGIEELKKADSSSSPENPSSTETQSANTPVLLLTNSRFPGTPESTSLEAVARKTSYFIPRSSEVEVHEHSDDDKES